MKRSYDSDSYVNYMDIDSHDTYLGEGFFGSKYKYEYYFTHFSKAADEFAHDLEREINFSADDLPENTMNSINRALSDFEKKIKSEFDKKIEQLKQLI